jgi:D-alanine-D-alanine ligase
VAAFSYDDRVLLERHVEGRELAVSLLDGEPLPTVEVHPKEEDLFNYEARYEIGRTDYVCPAELPGALADAVQAGARATYEALGCTGFARVDAILDASEVPKVLEANAIPGLTDTSLLPMAADAAGIGFEQLVERMIRLALTRATSAVPS